MKNQRGAVYLETLIAFLPVFLFFFGTLQIADLSMAHLVVEHAASSAARAAVVVLPDDGAYYEDDDNVGVNQFTNLRQLDVEQAAEMILSANPRLDRSYANVALDKGSYSERELLTAQVSAPYRCFVPMFCPGGITLTAKAQLVYQGAKFIYAPDTNWASSAVSRATAPKRNGTPPKSGGRKTAVGQDDGAPGPSSKSNNNDTDSPVALGPKPGQDKDDDASQGPTGNKSGRNQADDGPLATGPTQKPGGGGPNKPPPADRPGAGAAHGGEDDDTGPAASSGKPNLSKPSQPNDDGALATGSKQNPGDPSASTGPKPSAPPGGSATKADDGLVSLGPDGKRHLKVLNPQCFVAGTLVRTPRGAVPIESIAVGDEVLAYDLVHARVVPSRVTRTFAHDTDAIADLDIAYGLARSEYSLRGTPGHPFYVPEAKAFAAMAELERGAQLLTDNGDFASVLSVQAHAQHVRVFNFEVAAHHNYFVGAHDSAAFGVLVHNDCNVFRDVDPDGNPINPKTGLSKEQEDHFRDLIDGETTLQNKLKARYARYLAKYANRSDQSGTAMDYDEWLAKNPQVRPEVQRGLEVEDDAIGALGANDNNNAAGQRIEHPFHDAATNRDVKTRPDAIIDGTIVVESKYIAPTSKDKVLDDSPQLRAQRDLAEKLGGEHIIVMSSENGDFLGGKPPAMRPSSTVGGSSRVVFYDPSQGRVTHQWDNETGTWQPID